MKLLPIRSEVILSRMVRMIFYGLKSIGLAPISLQRKTRIEKYRSTCIWVFLFSKMGLFYNLVFPILLVIMVGIQLQEIYSNSTRKQNSSARAMDVLSDMLPIVSSFFIIVYWAFRQKRAAIILNNLMDVHCLLSDLEEKLSNRKPFVFPVRHVAFNISLWIFSYVVFTIYHGSFWAMCVVTTPFLVCYWFSIEYSITLGVVAREIESLNKNLLNLQECRTRLFHRSSLNQLTVSNSSSRSQLASLELLQGISILLFDVSHDVADFFSLPILPTIGSFTFTFIYGILGFITPFVVPMNNPSLIVWSLTVVFILMAIYPLIFLSFNVTETANQAKLTGRIVNKLLATTRDEEIIEKLAQISSQLLHEDISFTAYGFFSLDFTLLQSILGATVTYLVIIIQFISGSAQTDVSNSTLYY